MNSVSPKKKNLHQSVLDKIEINQLLNQIDTST